MIRESQPHSNDDDAFDALIKNTWATEPTLRDTIDPGILRLMHDAKSAEDALNFATDPSEDTIQEVLLNLNGDWDMLGFRDEAIKVTGRLRPTEYALEEDVVDNAYEGAFPGIGERKEDLLGEYFDAAGFRAIVKGFDVERVPMGEHGSMYRVVMQYGLDEDYEDGQVWFTSHPDDIEYMEPYQPSREGAEEFVRTNFPEVFAAVQALPDDCRDPEHIRQVLDDFSVTFDVSKADTTMGDDEVLDLIETYITDQLAFDNATYDAGVRGVIYGRTMTYAKVPKKYDGTLRALLISNVRLFPTPDTEEGQALVTYRPALETWYLVPEAQGGRTPVYIPIDSLTRLTTNRPETSAYPFDEDTIIQPNEQFDSNFGVRPLEQRMGEAVVDLVEQSSQNQTETEPLARDETLKNYLDNLRKLHTDLSPYLTNGDDRVYSSIEEAREAMTKAHPHLQAFVESLNGLDFQPIVEVSGEALRIAPARLTSSADIDKDHAEIAIDKLSPVLGDIATMKRGAVVEIVTRLAQIGEEPDERYGLKAFLKLVDMSVDDPAFGLNDKAFQLPMVVADFTRYVYVDLSKDALYSIPELDANERVGLAMKQLNMVETTVSRRSIAVATVERLADAISNETSSITSYEDVDKLRDLALMATEEEKLMNVSAEAIEAILGYGRYLLLTGPYYEDGELFTEGGVAAYLDGVITSHPSLRTQELALVLSTPAEEGEHRYVVPLSTLEEMAF